MPEGWTAKPLRALIEKPVAGFWGEDMGGLGLRSVRVVRNGDAASHYTLSVDDLPQRWMHPAQIAKSECLVNDVLLASSGDVGAVARLDTTGEEVVAASNFVRRVRAREGTEASWLFFLLQTNLAQEAARKCSGGTTLQNLSGRFFDEFLAPVPTRGEQRRVGEILNTVDGAIRSTERLIAKLDLMKQGLLHDLLSRGIDENGDLRDLTDRPDQFVLSPIGTIPASWQILSCQDATSAPIGYGIVQAGPYVPHGVFVLMIRDLDGDFRTDLHRTSPSIDAAYGRSRVRPGDVLLSVKATIGRVAVVPDWFEGNISRDMARLRPGPGCRPSYLRILLSSELGRRILQQTIVGTTRAEVSIGVLRKVLIPLPPIDEQDRMVSACEALESQVDAREAELSKLRVLKAGLMYDLLTGRVCVSLDHGDAA
jgi:Restriction endonuclease S subunits